MVVRIKTFVNVRKITPLCRTAVLSFCVLFFLCAHPGDADTVVMATGEKVKGIVIEQYKDRILLSTYKGEIIIKKADIQQIAYDDEVDNLIALGETYKAKGDMEKAYYHYAKAYYTNPGSTRAKDGYMLLKGALYADKQNEKKNIIRQRMDIEKWYSEGAPEAKSAEEIKKERIEKLNKRYGISIVEIYEKIYVRKVRQGSPAASGGLRRGDILVSLWGKMLKYMNTEEVIDLLINHAYAEVKMVVQRDLLFLTRDKGGNPIKGLKSSSGITFDVPWDGLTAMDVAEASHGFKAGLRSGDIIHAIGGKLTRYTPLKKAVAAIYADNPDGNVLTIRRNIAFWLKKEEL